VNIRELHEKYVNIVHFQEIVYKVARYGFSDLLDLLHIDVVALGLARKVGLVSKDYSPESRPRRFRQLLEELGPTFIKLGQILSAREELLPEPYLKELENLQEKVTPVTGDEVKTILCEFYQCESLDEVFGSFEEESFASASISQVHRATTKSGDKVIVKVQRSHIREIIQKDVGVLSYIVELLEEQFGDPKGCASWTSFFEEFIKEIVNELDFIREALLMQRFSVMFDDEEGISVPKVYKELSGKTVLVQEFIDGIRVQEVTDQKSNPKIDRKKIGESLVKGYFKQVFSEGIFHGDPHPGNLRIKQDGTLVFLDFGMIGQIETETMNQMIRIFWGAGNDDFALVARSICKICRGTVMGVTGTMIMDLRDMIHIYKNSSLSSICIRDFMHSLDELLTNNELKLPPQLSLLLKALITLEIVSKQLSPNLNLMDFLLPEINRMIRSRFELKNLKRNMGYKMFEAYDLLMEFPHDVFHIIKNIQKLQNEASWFRTHKLDTYIVRMEKTFHRAILGLVISAFLMASSILLAYNDSGDQLVYVLGACGYIVTGIFALILIYTIVTTKIGKN
jgi:ubiquinone biosynthesis protein